MPRRAHRRCKEQGPTCNGVAHPGFDVCARCLHDVLRPRMREEKAMMRARRAERLSKENRDLISEVDLKEPHIKTSQEVWEAVDPPKPSISRIITEVQVDKEMDEAYERGLTPGQFLGEKLLEIALETVPVVIETVAPTPEPNEALNEPSTEPQEEQSESMPKLAPIVVDIPSARRKRIPMDIREEIVAAYQAGMAVEEICRAWDIGVGTLYSTLNKLKVPRRTKEPVMPDKSLPEVSPVRAPSAPPNGAVSDLSEWLVTYTVTRTETATVAARDFNAAASTVAAQFRSIGEDIEVQSVARARQ